MIVFDSRMITSKIQVHFKSVAFIFESVLLFVIMEQNMTFLLNENESGMSFSLSKNEYSKNVEIFRNMRN